MLALPGVGSAVGRAVGRAGQASGRAAPALTSIYRRLPSSSGLPFGATVQTQRRSLLEYYARLDHYLASVQYHPRISIVVPTYRPVHRYLHEMVGSVALQTYPNWQLCVVDDAGGDAEVTRILADFAAAHPGRVAFATRVENGHIAAASNDALAMADGDYVALLDHDDRLYPHALAEVVLGLNAHRQPDGRFPAVLYTDERMIDEDGAPIGEVWLKPDWMPLLHLTSNYTNHLTVYDRAMLVELGGFRSGFDGSQDHDLMLRATEASAAAGVPVVHVPTIAYQWRSHPGSVAKDPGVKSYSIEPAMRAVAQACQRRGRPARVWREAGIVANRIDFALPGPRPRVVVVILPVGGDADRCEAALRTTDYPGLEVVRVPDDGRAPAAGLDEVLATTAADFLAVVADDLDADRHDWVAAMVGLAQLPEVGAVGGLVLESGGSVASAGLVGLGSAGTAPAMAGLPPTEEVYLAWPASIHEVLAVPVDVMMVDVVASRAVGGFGADPAFAFFHFGTDLCLRLREVGLGTVFTPYAEFSEQAPRMRYDVALDERSALVAKWSHWLSSDPYMNPGLARSGQFRVDPELTFPEVPPVLFDTWLATHRIG
ncbi:MAG: hypothetical protein QG597_480 [Actinomycetota bacterium]|nr:hypothetical protein [Actinomycetota bacterium]